MYVCLCHSVSDRGVRAAIEEGARSVEDLGRRLGAGTDCGQCRPLLEQLVAEASEGARGAENDGRT